MEGKQSDYLISDISLSAAVAIGCPVRTTNQVSHSVCVVSLSDQDDTWCSFEMKARMRLQDQETRRWRSHPRAYWEVKSDFKGSMWAFIFSIYRSSDDRGDMPNLGIVYNISVNIQRSSSLLLLNQLPLSRMLNQRCYITDRGKVKVNPRRQLPCAVSLCGGATFQYRFRLLLELKCVVLCATWSLNFVFVRPKKNHKTTKQKKKPTKCGLAGDN